MALLGLTSDWFGVPKLMESKCRSGSGTRSPIFCRFRGQVQPRFQVVLVRRLLAETLNSVTVLFMLEFSALSSLVTSGYDNKVAASASGVGFLQFTFCSWLKMEAGGTV